MKQRARERQAQPPAWEPLRNAHFPDGDPSAADPNYVGTFRNNLYQVTMREYKFDAAGRKYTWLIIRRTDSEAVHDWRHLQRIKNELCSPEREAIELYPAESRLVDASNQYHLFVMPEGFIFPFGYRERDVADQQIPGSKNKQRPFDARPADLNARSREDVLSTIFGDYRDPE